ncbi:LPS-assembly protein LptD [Stenotrophomonas mori]|uniref:LPS-assembly protein LptD n=1 Tax=Stenotrophomonas mori TaxID=2871096 RepID=UPI0020213DE1
MRRALRLLPLPLSVAICLPAMASEKPVNWNLCPATDALPAFDEAPQADPTAAAARDQLPTDIEGNQLSGTTTVPQYEGNVALKRGDQFMGTDSLRFDTETGNYIAEGNIRYSDSSIRLTARRAEGNQETDSHKISDIHYQLVSRRGNGSADSIDLQGSVGQMHRSTYTTCAPSQPVWKLSAPQIEVDNEEGFGTARNAVLRVGSVPVMYMPWFKFPIDDRRMTGLLYPKLSLSGRNGFDYGQPIYFNLAPNYDDTLTPRWMSERGLMLSNEFRYLYGGGRGQLDTAWMPSDSLRDRERGKLQYRGYHNLDRHWQARANLSWVSDERYMEDFANRLIGVTASNLQSTVGLYGTGRTWTAGLMADRWQLTDYTLTERALPYNRQPRLFGTWDDSFGRWFEAGVYAEAVRFTHDDIHLKRRNAEGEYERTGKLERMYGGSRLDIKPYVSMPLAGAAWYITPTLAWRYTAYELERELADDLRRKQLQAAGINPATATPEQLRGNTSPHRSLPIASLDMGVYFDRETQIGDTAYLHTLEPRLFYLNTPYRDQSDLPLFDTRAFTFSWGQLFRDSRFTGADRQNDANQLTTAVTTRLIRQDDGREKLSASIGQITYFEDSRARLDYTNANEPIVQQGKSAWVADVNWALNDRWTLGSTYQWNPKYRKEDLASVRARYLLPEDGVVNLAYRYRRNPSTNADQLRQADLSFLYPINPRWSLVGRYYYSMLDHKPLEIIGGVQWDSCCLAVRALARRYVRNREGDMNNSFQLEFVLKGLSSLGQDTDRTLRRAILGYNRDDLYLVPPSNIEANEDDYDPNLIP